MPSIDVRPLASGQSAYVVRGPGDALLELVPERGALATRLRLGGEELLFLDESTLLDLSKNVRGGIPILFPIAGKLASDQYSHEGITYAMKQHGFARVLPWATTAETSDDSAVVECRLEPSAVTRAQYPFDFAIAIRFVLTERRLELVTTIENRGAAPMPWQLGFHPYFRVPVAAKPTARIATDATQAFDNRTGKTDALGPIDLTRDEIDLHLIDHLRPGTTLERFPLPPIRLSWDPAFSRLVVWTLKGRDFVCVEPWVGAGGALGTASAPVLAPGAGVQLAWSIGVD